MSRYESPFGWHRWEHDPQHLFFVDRELRERLESPHPVYITGARGTGKTTLLRVLEWEHRLENPSLRSLLGNDVFRVGEARLIGAYAKWPEHGLQKLHYQTEQLGPEMRSSITSIYLDLYWLEAAIDAISRIASEGIVDVSNPGREDHIAACFDAFPRTLNGRGLSKRRTLRDLSDAVVSAREEIENPWKFGFTIEEVARRQDPLDQLGHLGRLVGAHLVSMLPTKAGKWYMKVGLDEAEYLSSYQLQVFNTHTRLAEFPVFPVLAFLGRPAALTSTVHSRVTIQREDVDVIDLRERLRRPRFREFAEGVTRVRLQHMGYEPKFTLDAYLGCLDINALLYEPLAASTKKWAEDLLVTAEERKEHGLFRDHLKRSGRSRRDCQKQKAFPTPIYETYLSRKVRVEMSDEALTQREKRRQESAQLRKRMVAAYLSITKELSVDPRYASADMVLGMSDGRIRDFLMMMHGIHRAAGNEVDLADPDRPVEINLQDSALSSFSKSKAAILPNSGVASPRKTDFLVKGLAKLTSALQRSSPDLSHLRSSERGIFSLPIDESVRSDESAQDVIDEIREADEAGFLKIVAEQSDEIRFRVHASLAAAYLFSYRGAYYRYPLEWRQIFRLRSLEGESEMDAWVAEIAGEALPSLFEE